jgi:hypothetical protein
MRAAESPSPWKSIYALLIVVAVGAGAGRICSASRVYEPELAAEPGKAADRRGSWPVKRPQPMPTFGSNDRSRWATVRALVDEGTFVIGRRDKSRVFDSAVCLLAGADPLQGATLAASGYRIRVTGDRGIIFEDGWTSVDKVMNPQTLQFYSSKPPLFSTIVAGLYWLLQAIFGWTLKDNPFAVVRTTLVLVNLVPFAIYLALLGRLLDRFNAGAWSRFFVLTAACFATLMTPFLITLNNHTVATCCVVFAIYPVFGLLQLPWRKGIALPSPAAFALSGVFAGFTVCNELPAAAFAAALGIPLLLRAPRQTLLYFLTALLIPLAALVATNFVALGEVVPAYSKFGGPWYEYEGSHWRKPPPGLVKYGIDWARMHESRGEYAFNVLVGHHGLFSLSPIWLLAAGGMAWAVCSTRSNSVGRAFQPQKTVEVGLESPTYEGADISVIGGMTLLVTVVVVSFYIYESDNYGGWTSGLRWLMWLTPLWLLTMLPVVDWLSERRWGRWLALGLLGWSVFSVSYPAWNPWRHPWLYNLLDSGGYIPY